MLTRCSIPNLFPTASPPFWLLHLPFLLRQNNLARSPQLKTEKIHDSLNNKLKGPMNVYELKIKESNQQKKGEVSIVHTSTSMKWFSAHLFGSSWPCFGKHCPQHSTSEIWTDSKTTTLERTGFQDLSEVQPRSGDPRGFWFFVLASKIRWSKKPTGFSSFW